MSLATRAVVLAALGASLLAAASCNSAGDGGRPAPATATAEPAVAAPAQVTYDDQHMPVGLLQYNPYSDRLTSGAQPEGEEAFRNLAALGYRHIISVDGALPDVETAKKYGLHYVHVPIQYSGVTREEELKIAKAIDMSDGPVYLHCHHGKHRSAAALSAVCVATGVLTVEQALAEMAVSGTDPKYVGLFRDVKGAQPISKADLAAVSGDLPESVSPGDLATAMVSVDLRWENMKASKAAAWGVPPENADVDPPHEARMLWEQFREIARLPAVASHGEAFAKFLADGESNAKSLEDALRAKDAKAADDAFGRGAKSCTACHSKYRDN